MMVRYWRAKRLRFLKRHLGSPVLLPGSGLLQFHIVRTAFSYGIPAHAPCARRANLAITTRFHSTTPPTTTLAQPRTRCFRKRTAAVAIPSMTTFDRIKPCSDPITMKRDTREFFSTPPMCSAIIVVAKSANWRKMNVSCVITSGLLSLAKGTLYHGALPSVHPRISRQARNPLRVPWPAQHDRPRIRAYCVHFADQPPRSCHVAGNHRSLQREPNRIGFVRTSPRIGSTRQAKRLRHRVAGNSWTVLLALKAPPPRSGSAAPLPRRCASSPAAAWAARTS